MIQVASNGAGAHGEEIRRLVSEVDELTRIDGRRALTVARLAQRLAAAARSPELTALAARSVAHALRNLSRHREALALYNRAGTLYRRQGNAVEAARTEIGRIDSLMYLGRYRQALKAAAEARRTLARHGERVRVMRLDLNAGNIYHRLERHREALRCYERARRAAGSDSDSLSLAIIDYNRANSLTMLGRHEEAEAIYEGLLADAQAAGRHRIAAHADYNFAYLRFLQGRYDEALTRFESARRRFAAEGDSSFVGSCDLDRAEVLLELNQVPEASRLARAGERIFERLHMRAERARALWLRGIAAGRTGDQDAARRLLDAGRRLFVAEGNGPSVAMTDLARATLHRRAGRLGLARRLAGEAMSRFRAQGLVLKHVQAELLGARVLLDSGAVEAAQAAALRASRRGGSLPAPWLEYQWHHILARAAEAKRGRSRALPFYRRALDAIERMRWGVQVDERKIAIMADKMEVYEDATRAALAGRYPRLDLAFEFVERGKSRALLDALHASLRDLITSRGRSPKALRLEHEILGIYNLLNASSRSGQRDGARLSQDLLRRVRRCEHELGRLEEGRALTPVHAKAGPGLDEVVATLGERRTLVEFFPDRGQVSALTISGRGVAHHPHLIARDDLDELLERFRLLIGRSGTVPEAPERRRRVDLAAAADILSRVGEALAPALPPPGDGHELLIVPHGSLHYLPLHACTVGNAPLSAQYPIEYAPSAAVWHGPWSTLDSERAIEEAPAEGENDGALPAGAEVVLVGPPEGRLAGADREIELLRARFPGARVLAGKTSTVAGVLAELSSAHLIHFATHCQFRPDRPELSGLELTDGWLRVADLAGLKLQARLVTLSACATGPGQVRAGDEVIGLLRGFLSAGASKVLASLWPVSDEETLAFMGRFYSWLDRVPAATALQRTMEEIRAGDSHPYTWAPFVLYARRHGEGDPQPRRRALDKASKS